MEDLLTLYGFSKDFISRGRYYNRMFVFNDNGFLKIYRIGEIKANFDKESIKLITKVKTLRIVYNEKVNIIAFYLININMFRNFFIKKSSIFNVL